MIKNVDIHWFKTREGKFGARVFWKGGSVTKVGTFFDVSEWLIEMLEMLTDDTDQAQ